VPVAVWCPEEVLPEAWPAADSYSYTIDIGRIATKLKVGWLGWLPSKTFTLAPAGVPPWAGEPLASEAPRAGGDCLIFAHGFLGSPYDLAHACEALASDGFVVAAPELPESLAASYEAREGVTREAIVRETQAAVEASVGDASGISRRWGIFGHSAGSGTALTQPGVFALGRAALATSFGRGLEASTPDPLFLVASEADGCNAFMQANGAPSPAEALSLSRVSGSHPFSTFESPRAAYAEPPPPRRGVLLFREGQEVVPYHISFLWEASNEAMFELLGPLIPLAKALNLFLLDFDKERDARLAAPTAALLVPALRRFFAAFATT